MLKNWLDILELKIDRVHGYIFEIQVFDNNNRNVAGSYYGTRPSSSNKLEKKSEISSLSTRKYLRNKELIHIEID